MTVPTVQLSARLHDVFLSRAKGLFVEATYDPDLTRETSVVFKDGTVHLNLAHPVFTETTHVLKPNGETLFILVRDVLPPDVCAVAYENLLGLGGSLESTRRSTAISEESGGKQAREGVIGFTGAPECRPAAFCRTEPQRFARTLPFIRYLDRVYREFAPAEYEYQLSVGLSYSDYLIPQTCCSTITVNSTVRTRLHADENNLKGGLGIYAALIGGDFRGGELVIPEFRVAVNFRSQDVLLCDSHVLHGNTRMVSDRPFQRLAIISYFSELVKRCAEKAA